MSMHEEVYAMTDEEIDPLVSPPVSRRGAGPL